MLKWWKLIYCQKCRRPLRDYEYKVIEEPIMDNGSIKILRTYTCSCCDGVCHKPENYPKFRRQMIWSPIIVSILHLLERCYLYYNNLEDISGPIAGVSLLLFLIVFPPAWYLVWRDTRKGKLIYDRWVMQHGTDPDKWPGASKPQ